MAELKPEKTEDEPDTEPIDDGYELVAFSKLRIDYDYIMELLRSMVVAIEETEEEFRRKLAEVREIIQEFAEDNPKLSKLLLKIVDEVEADKARFAGQDIAAIINRMREEAVDREIKKYADKWYIPFDDVKYEAYHYKDGEMANENMVKEAADFSAYKANNPDAMKFEFHDDLIEDFHKTLMPEVGQLLED